MQRIPEGIGWIEVVCGSMFSGKTEELISRVRREMYARKIVQIFKPRTDNRYAKDSVVSHSDSSLPCYAIDHASDMLRLLQDDVQVVGIDECQFFGLEVVGVAEELANRGIRVICAGLDQDYLGKPFQPMPQLMAIAEYVTKKLAVCMVCGNPANRSQRMTASESLVVIGAQDAYEARCRKCHSAAAIAAPDQQSLPIGEPEARRTEQPSLPLISRER